MSRINHRSVTIKNPDEWGTRYFRMGANSLTLATSKATTPAKTIAVKPQAEQCAAKGIRVGSMVELDHKGKTHKGKVVRFNAKTVSIKVPGYRGNWTWPASKIRLSADQPAPKAPVTMTLKVGQSVQVRAYTLRKVGTQVLKELVGGVITKVNRTDGTYEVAHEGLGSTRSFKANEVRQTSRRDEDTIMNAIYGVYMGLSPENLTCDGERSKTEQRRVRARLNRTLKALEKELGSEVSEEQAFTWYDFLRR